MADPHRVDDLRDRLRALGYLDAGLDRYVLATARSGVSARSLALGASVRIGLLVGVLLGVSSAVAIALRIPSLVTGVRDLAVLAGYLTAIGVVASALVAWAALVGTRRLTARALHTGRLAGRVRSLARAAGALSGGACLAYLTLWWRTFDPAAGWETPGATALALVVAVLTSLLLGTTISSTAMALASLDDAAETVGRRNRRSWRASALMAAVAFAAASLLLLATSQRSPPPGAPSLTVVPTGLSTTVVGLDGFDVVFAERAAARLGLAHLREVLDAPSASLARPEDRDPARVWTTIATGLPPSRHGVEGLDARSVLGLEGRMPAPRWRLADALGAATDLIRLTRPVAGSGLTRREPAFWEVAARAGLRTASLNWWATWPALPQDGIVVTDRAALRLERGGTLDREIVPASLYEPLREGWPKLRESAAARTAPLLEGTAGHVRAALERSAAIDGSFVGLAVSAYLGETDLLAVYLPGLDIAREALVGEEAAAAPLGDLASRIDGLERYYALVDAWLGMLKASSPGRTLIVIGSPGRAAGSGQASLFLLDARHVAAGTKVSGRIEDVAPTVVHALGGPVSTELAGRPLAALFGAEFSARHPVRAVATWGRREPSRAAPSGQPGLDDEMRERLRSLGYVR
jgi:hypothetical protein